MKQKYYRLWSYTEEVAKKLEEEGYSPGYYGYTVSDWLEDVKNLIGENKFGRRYYEMSDM